MTISKIRKRDGQIVNFNPEKISLAIWKAVQAVGGNDREKAQQLAQQVVKILDKEFNNYRIPTVEDVQDVVEKVLIENGHVKVAKAYILYRQERAKVREEVRELLGGRLTRMKSLSLNALRILAGRYLLRNLDGHVIETPEEMFDRVATAIAETEKIYGKSNQEIEKIKKDFLEIMASLEFLPAGRTITNAGSSTRLVSNCIVLHMEDSMDGIFTTLRDASLLQQAGSGLGFPFHLLRPAGSAAVRSRGVASGPVSFLKVYDRAFGVIKQQGRHGANMCVMNVKHPDILEFIHCKAREGDIRNFNISVAVTDDFMQKVLDNDPNPWMCEWRGTEMLPRRVERDEYDVVLATKEEKITAREIMEEIISAAWRNGEPGIIFIDEVNRTNPVPGLGRIEACNPCGEQFLHDGDVCNLGSINLEKFMENGQINWERLRFVVQTATRMLDNVIELTDFPVEKVNRVFRGNRRIGLGVMGWADILIKLGIPYNSDEAMLLAEQVMEFINENAHKMSEKLAEEKGTFPNWEKSVFYPNKKMRNAALTCVAPTGSISMICDVASGIEPYFALVYQKSQVMGGQSLYYINKHLEKVLKERRLYSERLIEQIEREGSIQNIPGIPDDIKKIFVVSLGIKPEDHVRIQAAFQKHTDNSISKTINLPNDATKEDVLTAYIQAWQTGCKSITVYRSGSRQKEVLHLVKDESMKMEEQIQTTHEEERIARPLEVGIGQLKSMTKSAMNQLTNCPECQGILTHQEGCITCANCGFSACTL